MNDRSYIIDSVYTLKQPLSHIGTSESTTTFLNTIRVMSDGKPTDVFAYTGNAIRGAWRDAGARYMCDALQSRVNKQVFNLLFSGGSISGTQSVDIAQARRVRDALPFLSVFGGGVGNQILSGRMTQGFAYPVCKETRHIIPRKIPSIDYDAIDISWRLMTGEIEFSRKDDTKDRLGDTYITLPPAEQATLLDDGGKGKKASKADTEPPTQMRYTVEYLIAGSQLWHRVNITCNELELGALVSCIHEWAKSPVLGGMCGKGFGAVDLEMIIQDNESKQPQEFIAVTGNFAALAPVAREAKETYDAHLRRLYNEYLITNKQTIAGLIAG